MAPFKLPNTAEITRRTIRIKNSFLRNALSECIGTFLLLFIGTSVTAQMVLFRGKINSWVQITIGWGFGLTVAVVPVYQISGAHLNPAISILSFTLGMLDVLSLFIYIVAQHVGAFLGAAATYCVYHDAINNFDGGIRAVKGPNETASIFATYPQPYMTPFGTFVDQIGGTGLLAFSTLAIVDPRNKIPIAAHPLLFGITLLIIGCGFGVNCGFPLNPARDLGPRLFTSLIYGKEVFTYPWRLWFLVPILVPIIGALFGGWSYILFLGSHIPDVEPTGKEKRLEKDKEQKQTKAEANGTA